MSGRRHHFIPQFVQTGFTNTKGMVFVFFRNGKIIEVKPENIGHQRDFYDSDSGNADILITHDEGIKYSRILSALRDNKKVNNTQIAELLAHLTVRTKSVRELSSDLSLKASELILKKIANPQICSALMLAHIKNNPDEMIKLFRKQPEFRASGITQALFIELMTHIAKEHPETFLPFVKNMHDKLDLSIFQKGLKEAINKRLISSTAPETRVNALIGLDYQLVDLKSNDAVLSDAMVVYQSDTNEWSILPRDHTKLKHVYLPLSPNRLLVGSYTGIVDLTDLNIYREMAIKCSHQFFIAREKERQPEAWQEWIGQNSFLLDEKQKSRIIDQVITELSQL